MPLSSLRSADTPADSPATVNLKLSLITIATAAPTITGWEPADWTADAKSHTLTHHSTDIGVYAAQPSEEGMFFSGQIGRGFLIAKPKVEWVANHHDPNNYLLFTLDRTGLEMFTVSSGKRVPHGSKIAIPSLSKYQIMVQISPGRITTSLSDWHGWKQLSDWTGLPENVDAGKLVQGPVKVAFMPM
jgi:hypothetical protein